MKNIFSLSWERAFGEPVRLRELLASEQDRLAVDLAPKGVAEEQVTDWGNWHDWSAYGMLCGPSETRTRLSGWKMRNGHYLGNRISCEALGELVCSETDAKYTCDIRAIEGLLASKQDLTGQPTLDNFARVHCAGLIGDVSDAGLEKLMQHEARLNRGVDSLSLYEWDGRLFYSNIDGSHRFAAARYVAGELGSDVPITGRLDRHMLSETAVAALRSEFEIFVLPDASTLPASFDLRFIEALEVIEASYYKRNLPRPHGRSTAIFLPKADGRSMKAAGVLRDAGVLDLGCHLQQLIQRQVELKEQFEDMVMCGQGRLRAE